MPKRRMSKHAVTQPLDKPYRFIPLTQGQNTIVDAADFDWLNQWNWCAQWDDVMENFYATRRERIPDSTKLLSIKMHRLILGCTQKDEEGDHKDGDTLNNRRENLRKCTHKQNVRNRRKTRINTSGFTGVWRVKGKNKIWTAQIGVDGKRVYLGRFNSPEDAGHAYDEAAKRYFGEFAHKNL